MEIIKKLTGKNPRDFEFAANQIINNADVEAFENLVGKEDFLFDFVKQNVANRLEKACNANNFRNLFSFLKFYSPSYEDFIVKTLAKYCDDDVTDEMLIRFEQGTDDEKAYCAKFFSIIQDTLALNDLKENAFSEFEPLAYNCAKTLAVFNDNEIYEQMLAKLHSSDAFEQYDAVKFLVAYGDIEVLDKIFDILPTSQMAENIAAEIIYLVPILNLLDGNMYENALITVNLILNGLGEFLPLSQIFDLQLYEIFETLINSEPNAKSAVTLLRAREKFEILTENDEYIYDENKDTKNEIFDIKNLLNSFDAGLFEETIPKMFTEETGFELFAIDLVNDERVLRQLLNSKNQTVVLKSLEKLKSVGKMTESDRDIAASNVKNEDILKIIRVL